MKQHEFEQAIEAQRPRLLKVAANLVGREAAADVVQVTLVSAHAGREWKSMELDAFSKWLTTALQNDCKNYLEAGHRRLDHEAEYVERHPARVLDEDDLVRRVDVQRAVAALPHDVQRAVFAIYIEGATYREAAAELDVPLATLHALVSAGLRDLRGLLRTNAPSARLQEVQSDKEGGHAGS